MINNNWTLDSPDLSSDEYQDKLSPKNKLSPKKTSKEDKVCYYFVIINNFINTSILTRLSAVSDF